MGETPQLPPGQWLLGEFPRFGLPQFADRRVAPGPVDLRVAGDVAAPRSLDAAALAALPRREQTSDFHCVTTWSRTGLRWGGYQFRDVYERLLLPAAPRPDARLVVFRCLDGYQASLPLDDVLADSVLLADTLDGVPLSADHGAPLRLVAPAHYGYKNPKHLCAVELWRDARRYRFPARKYMDHPRARVRYEERGRWLPGWLYRRLYRGAVGPTIRAFRSDTDGSRSG